MVVVYLRGQPARMSAFALVLGAESLGPGVVAVDAHVLGAC